MDLRPWRGGGQVQKTYLKKVPPAHGEKGPTLLHHNKKVSKRPPHGEKGPPYSIRRKSSKKLPKRPPHGEKSYLLDEKIPKMPRI